MARDNDGRTDIVALSARVRELWSRIWLVGWVNLVCERGVVVVYGPKHERGIVAAAACSIRGFTPSKVGCGCRHMPTVFVAAAIILSDLSSS